MGFDVINNVTKKLDLGFFNYDARIDAEYIKARIAGKEYMFLKPQTYMNLSGDSVRRVINYYKIPETDVVVIYDDMDTPKGSIRIKTSGGSAGHNGIKSILPIIQNFLRIKVGIGKISDVSHLDKVDYVISKISEEEKLCLRKAVETATDALIELIESDFDKQKIMTKYNYEEKHKI